MKGLYENIRAKQDRIKAQKAAGGKARAHEEGR